MIGELTASRSDSQTLGFAREQYLDAQKLAVLGDSKLCLELVHLPRSGGHDIGVIGRMGTC